MGKAVRSVQASLRKFLYDGHLSNLESSDSDSLGFTGAQSAVKTKIESPYSDALRSQGSAGSRPPLLVAEKAQPALSLESDCLLIESKSTLAKARELDLVILDVATTSPSHDLA
jgi:hypothetical protein